MISHTFRRANSSKRFDWRLRAPSRQRVVERPTVASKSAKSILRKYPDFAEVVQGEPFHDAIQNYEDHFLPLLTAEQAEDEAVWQARLSKWSLTRLRNSGYCFTGMSAYWLQANQFGRPVASFFLGPGLTLPENKFENGTQVLISRIDPLNEQPLKGCVVSHTSSQIHISFPERFDLEEGEWRLDVGRSNIVYQRMRNAISYLNQNPTQQETASIVPDSQFILQGTYLRDVLLRNFEPTRKLHSYASMPYPVTHFSSTGLEPKTLGLDLDSNAGAFKGDMRIQSWAKRYAELNPVAIEGDPVLHDLNPSQTRAVAMMIGQRFSLVQGPPGTGKTKTIIEAIKLLKVHFEVQHPILVCTYTNVAVDNLVEGLVSSGVNALRVAFGGSVRDSVFEHTLDYKLSKHPQQPPLCEFVQEDTSLAKEIATLEVSLEELHDQQLAGDVKATARSERLQRALSARRREQNRARSRIYALRQEMLRDVITDADVICTTCITSACMALNVTDFPVVFLDEASMSTEPASLIPIMKGSQHVALIGDHKQLPPVITSTEALSRGLGISLFERLTEEGVVPSIMLDTQYRMHPAISRFPSSEFYNLNLQDGTVDPVGNVQPWLHPPESRHLKKDTESGNWPSVIFLDHTGSETRKDRSWINAEEADIVASVVEDLLLSNARLQGHDIGIIAPYVAQITLLNRLLKHDSQWSTRFKEVLGDQRAMQLANIEIKTVDGFEGREKDVIIFSTVRNNAGGYIGFLADRRRLNVGLTRAKRGLFVVGNINTLKAGKVSRTVLLGGSEESVARVRKGVESWQRYAQFLIDHGLVIRVEDDLLGQALDGTRNSILAMV